MEKEEEIEEDKQEKRRLSGRKDILRYIDPLGDVFIQGARLTNKNTGLWNEKLHKECFLTFLPVDFIKNTMLPATNAFAKANGHNSPFSYEELIYALGMLKMMEVVKLPERQIYWCTKPEGFFPAFNFGRLMSIHQFEEFLNM